MTKLVTVDRGNEMTQMHEVPSVPAMVRAEIPAEPAIESVVLDSENVAWQARQHTGGPGRVWVRAGTMVPMLSITPVEGVKPWPRLLVEHGPVTLVYRAE